MVNTNVIISASAVLVAMLLTIVSLMRQNGGPTDNYSVSVSGTAVEDGETFQTEIYFCTGDDCQFYGVQEKGFSLGFFALTGFKDDTKTYVTEHSVGVTFVYDSVSKDLVDCVNGDALSKNDFAKEMSQVENVADEVNFTVDKYVINADPSTDSPSIFGFNVATVDACQKVWKDKQYASYSGVVESDEEDRSDSEVVEIDEEDSDGRNLGSWSTKVKVDAGTFMKIVDFAYARPMTGNTGMNLLPSGYKLTYECVVDTHHCGSALDLDLSFAGHPNHDPSNPNDVCIGGQATAYIVHKYPSITLVFTGTDDSYEKYIDMKVAPPGDMSSLGYGNTFDILPLGLNDPNLSEFLYGFYVYTMWLRECVNGIVDQLKSRVDFIVGHSLGGAAATIYRTIESGRVGTTCLVTFGAPVTARTGSCRVRGGRFFHENDPVTSHNMNRHAGINHDLTYAVRLWSKLDYPCSSSWKARCWKKKRYYLYKRGENCKRLGSGCNSLIGCGSNMGYHSVAEYKKYSLHKHSFKN